MLFTLNELNDDEKTTFYGLRRSLRKKHRMLKHRDFLTKCDNEKMLPNLTFIAKLVKNKAYLTK